MTITSLQDNVDESDNDEVNNEVDGETGVAPR